MCQANRWRCVSVNSGRKQAPALGEQAPSLDRQRKLERRTYARRTRRFKEVAEELGGLIIKLGQYLSVRVDMLLREYTEELSALQDSVSPVPF